MRMNGHWSLRARGAVTAHLGINGLLASARAGLDRVGPARARYALAGGGILIDTRPEFQRRADGEIPGAIVIERNHLEWRCDPASPARIPEVTGYQVTWIICCDEGYSSSLAAVPAGTRAVQRDRPDRRLPGLARGRASGVQNTGADQATADLTASDDDRTTEGPRSARAPRSWTGPCGCGGPGRTSSRPQ
jgi:hypothetical protein